MNVAMVALNTLIALGNFATWSTLIYLLRTDGGRLSRKTLIRTVCIACGVYALLCPLWQWRTGTAIPDLDGYIILGFLLSAPHVFWMFPGRLHKNLFCVSVTTPTMVAAHGAGRLAEWFTQADTVMGRLLNLAVLAALFAAILAWMHWLTRRRFPSLYTTEYPVIWMRLWVITVSLGVVQLLSGNIYMPGFYSASTVFTRLVCLAGAGAILYIAGLAQQQAARAATSAARAQAAEEVVVEKDREFAGIIRGVEETRRMRHDLRQVFAAMQGMNASGRGRELEAYCLEVLAAMDANKKEVGREDT